MDVKTYDSVVDFNAAKARDRKDAGHKSAWGTMVEAYVAVQEGITLAAEYKELTGRGMQPSEAARKVFDKIGKAA